VTPRLFLHVLSIEARSRMSYRADFWITATVAVVGELALLFFLWKAVFAGAGASKIAGYDLDAMLLYYGLAVLFGRLVRGPDLGGTTSQDIYEGGLNRYLVFPVPYFGFKYAQHLGSLFPAVLQTLVFGLCLPLLLEVPEGVGPVSIVAGLLATLAANLLFFLLSFPLQAVAFWAENVWSLAVALRFTASLLGGAMLPLALFPDGARAALDVLPFRALFDFPLLALLGRLSPAEYALRMAHCLAWCAAIGWVGRAVWRRGTLQYSGIGM
jgi:ABC-2 type transport system permease protein